MTGVRHIRDALLHVFFPHVCAGCGSDLLNTGAVLCLRCLDRLPATEFERYPWNPVERKFWGRIEIQVAAAKFYFANGSLIQQLMHAFKYGGNKELGFQLGKMMGESLQQSGRFEVDALVPLPLFASREKKRGFNQSRVLCDGISSIMGIPVLDQVISRAISTDSQTRKGRIERWINMEGKFVLRDPGAIRDKHILLVDDVVTTGATLEACGAGLLSAENTRLSIATLCYASS